MNRFTASPIELTIVSIQPKGAFRKIASNRCSEKSSPALFVASVIPSL